MLLHAFGTTHNDQNRRSYSPNQHIQMRNQGERAGTSLHYYDLTAGKGCNGAYVYTGILGDWNPGTH